MEASIDTLQHGGDVLFLLLGAVMVFAMHAGFAFLEVGTVRRKNQVNAFVEKPWSKRAWSLAPLLAKNMIFTRKE